MIYSFTAVSVPFGFWTQHYSGDTIILFIFLPPLESIPTVRGRGVGRETERLVLVFGLVATSG